MRFSFEKLVNVCLWVTCITCINEMKGLVESTRCCLATFTRYPCFETTYPYSEPFAGTPYETTLHSTKRSAYPTWMDEGVDGYGQGIGIYRTHKLSSLKANMHRKRDNIPYYIRRITQGVLHDSGRKFVYRGGKLPDPTRIPVLTGHPSALTQFVHTEKSLIRDFSLRKTVAHSAKSYANLLCRSQISVVKNKRKADTFLTKGDSTVPLDFQTSIIYKPYVALHEQELSANSSKHTDESRSHKDVVISEEKLPLRKRFFFMK